MSIKTESTTDSPEEMTRAFEAIGQPVEISTFEDGLHETPTPDETPAPAQTGAPATPPAPAAPEPAEPEDEDLESAILDDTLPKGVRTRIQKLLAKATRQKYEAEAALKAAKPAEPPPAAPAEPAEPAATSGRRPGSQAQAETGRFSRKRRSPDGLH